MKNLWLLVLIFGVVILSPPTQVEADDYVRPELPESAVNYQILPGDDNVLQPLQRAYGDILAIVNSYPTEQQGRVWYELVDIQWAEVLASQGTDVNFVKRLLGVVENPDSADEVFFRNLYWSEGFEAFAAGERPESFGLAVQVSSPPPPPTIETGEEPPITLHECQGPVTISVTTSYSLVYGGGIPFDINATDANGPCTGTFSWSATFKGDYAGNGTINTPDVLPMFPAVAGELIITINGQTFPFDITAP